MITDDVIGHAKQKQYIVQWDFIYHEMMAVQNLHREYSGMIETIHMNQSATKRHPKLLQPSLGLLIK